VVGGVPGDFLAFFPIPSCVGAYSNSMTIDANGEVTAPSSSPYYVCYSTSSAVSDSDFALIIGITPLVTVDNQCHTTGVPTTVPTTSAPTTANPTFGVPTMPPVQTTGIPTSPSLTTAVPISGIPTTSVPNTVVPTTPVQTTDVPTATTSTTAESTVIPTTSLTTAAPTTAVPAFVPATRTSPVLSGITPFTPTSTVATANKTEIISSSSKHVALFQVVLCLFLLVDFSP